MAALKYKDSQGIWHKLYGGSSSSLPYVYLKQRADYLYEIQFDSYPELTTSPTEIAGCSTFTKDGKVYRNLDYEYTDNASFIVKTPEFVGMSFADGVLNGQVASWEMNKIEQLPNRVVDGINNSGLFISEHVAFNDYGFAGSTDEDAIPLYYVPNLILRNCTTHDELVEWINENKFKFALYQTLKDTGYILMFFIKIGDKCYSLQPNASKEYELFNLSGQTTPKLTNFISVGTDTITRTDSRLQSHPTGIERYNLINNGATLEDLKFTQCYVAPDRLSEFIGINNTSKSSSDAELTSIYNSAKNLYDRHIRDGKTWHTMHSVVYNLSNLSLSVCVQENFEHEYTSSLHDKTPSGGGTVEISTETDNAIVEKSDGLYVKDLSDKIEELKVYKEPDLIEIGTLNINDSVVDGFSKDNYFEFPFTLNAEGKPFEFYMDITTGSDVTGLQMILDSTYEVSIGIQNSGFLMALSSDGIVWDICDSIGTHRLSPHTNYRIRFSYDLSKYVLAYSIDNGNSWIDDISVDSSHVLNHTNVYIGCNVSYGTDNNYFRGSIDLNHWYIVFGNEIIWEGMDDAGLLTKLSVDLGNITQDGIKVIQEIVSDNIPINISQHTDNILTKEPDGLYVKAPTGTAISQEPDNAVEDKDGLYVKDYSSDITNLNNNDSKVKADNSTASKYLTEWIDNNTITYDSTQNVLKVTGISGTDTTVAEIQLLHGVTSNIQDQIDALSKPMTIFGVFQTKAELDVSTDTPHDGSTAIIQADEFHGGKQYTYIYVESMSKWVPIAESTVALRNFTLDPINLTNEVTGVLPENKVDSLIARLSQVLLDSDYRGSDKGVVKSADTLKGLTATIADLNNAHSHTNKVLLDSLLRNGLGDLVLSDDGTYRKIFQISTTAPLSRNIIWFDNTDPQAVLLKIHDGTKWTTVAGGGGGSGGSTPISQDPANKITEKSDGIFCDAITPDELTPIEGNIPTDIQLQQFHDDLDEKYVRVSELTEVDGLFPSEEQLQQFHDDIDAKYVRVADLTEVYGGFPTNVELQEILDTLRDKYLTSSDLIEVSPDAIGAPYELTEEHLTNAMFNGRPVYERLYIGTTGDDTTAAHALIEDIITEWNIDTPIMCERVGGSYADDNKSCIGQYSHSNTNFATAYIQSETNNLVEYHSHAQWSNQPIHVLIKYTKTV